MAPPPAQKPVVPAAVRLYAVGDEGQALQLEDGSGERTVNDIFLRSEYPPPGKAKSKRPGDTPIDHFENRISDFSRAMEAVERAFRAIAEVNGDDGLGSAPYPGASKTGIMGANYGLKIASVTDGLSNTAAFSESLLGQGTIGAKSAPGGPDRSYAYVITVTPAGCAKPNSWNTSNLRGYSWTAGELRCATYNHYYTPNTTSYDCFGITILGNPLQQFASPGFKAARSEHTNGVNVLFADGGVRFITNDVTLANWVAMGTRAGGDIVDMSGF